MTSEFGSKKAILLGSMVLIGMIEKESHRRKIKNKGLKIYRF